MITLKKHRQADIEAPCLPIKDSAGVTITWKAHLFNHDDPTLITSDITGVKDSTTNIIVFTFPISEIDAKRTGSLTEDKFNDGDKLTIEVWPTNNPTDMYWEPKAFKIEDSQVPVEPEESESSSSAS